MILKRHLFPKTTPFISTGHQLQHPPVDRSQGRHRFRHILILADIEGSSGCGSYRASKFLTRSWARACAAMSMDVDAVVRALFDAGIERVTVKDFHRTAYNLLPELIDLRARIIHGYHQGPVPGLGHPEDADAVMMLGMHAASGTSGFLPHTLTSRIARVTVNGRALTELELFSASLAPFGIGPVFFSGCPVACAQACERIPGIYTVAIDKRVPPEALDVNTWRRELARGAVAALQNTASAPFMPKGPLRTVIRIRRGTTVAARMADPWAFARHGGTITFRSPDIHHLYQSLIKICYLSPLRRRILPISLALSNLTGWLGLQWVRIHLARHPGH